MSTDDEQRHACYILCLSTCSGPTRLPPRTHHPSVMCTRILASCSSFPTLESLPTAPHLLVLVCTTPPVGAVAPSPCCCSCCCCCFCCALAAAALALNVLAASALRASRSSVTASCRLDSDSSCGSVQQGAGCLGGEGGGYQQGGLTRQEIMHGGSVMPFSQCS
jgi:hypothetical protein